MGICIGIGNYIGKSKVVSINKDPHNSFSNILTEKGSNILTEEIIDFKPPMMIEKGKQYKEDGVIYECILSSKLPISNKLKDLLGFYVKIIK